jgi:hypothetical protein
MLATVKYITVDNLTFAEKVANKIIDLGLAAPAVLLLEAHKPLAFLGSQLLLIAQPTLNIFLPQTLTRDSADLLADTRQFEHLIACLEVGLGRGPQPASYSSESSEVSS